MLTNTLATLLCNGNPLSREITILGDFNTDYSATSNPGKKKLKEIEIKYNLRQLIKAPTRQTSTTSTTIDLIFTSIPTELIVLSGIHKHILISDHLSTFVIKKKRREHHSKKIIHVRNKSNYNKEHFSYLLTDHPKWQDYWYQQQTQNQLWDMIVCIITECLDFLCPMKRCVIRIDQPDWFDGDLRNN